MIISMYDITVPPLALALGNIKHIMTTGAAFAAEHKLDEGVVLGSRLFPNMFPLTRQVQIATDMSKGCVGRLSGESTPKYEDTETTFDEIIARCDNTIAFVTSFSADKIANTEDKQVTLSVPGAELRFTGFDYVTKFVVPNVQFHAATAYNIFRSHGVPLGKRDFLGPIV